MTGDADAGDTVDSIVEDAVERADTGRDTFRAVSVDDRFRKTVRDDHAPNQALHDALKAAAEDDDRIHSVNLMGSHAPGNRHKGEPRYNVRVEVRNEGMGHPVLGATVAGRLVDRGDVRIEDVVECSDDHLVVSLRPVEVRVEPIDVPVADIPDSVWEGRVDRVPLCSAYECTNDADRDRRYQFESGFVIDVPLCDSCDEHIDATVFDDVVVGDVVPNRPPVEPIREWVDDNRDVFDTPGTLTEDGVDAIAEQIADAIARSDVDDPASHHYTATTEEIESFRADFDAEYDPNPLPGRFDVADFVPYSRRREGRPSVHVALQDKDDGSIVASVDTKTEEWEEVDTGRGIYNIRVDVGVEDGKSAKPVTAYVCHGCERKTLPEDFVTHDGVDGPACPRCGTAVDWDMTHDDFVGGSGE